MQLRAVLTQYHLETLRQLAHDAGPDRDICSNKTVLADSLCRALTEPEGVKKRLNALSEDQRTMVLTIVAEGGELLEDEAVEEFANGFLPRLQGQLDALFGLVFRDQRTLGGSCILVGIPYSLLKSIPFSVLNEPTT